MSIPGLTGVACLSSLFDDAVLRMTAVDANASHVEPASQPVPGRRLSMRSAIASSPDACSPEIAPR